MYMSSLNEVLGLSRFPSLDLHGYDRETARVAILDFIHDHCKMKNPYIVIIHGHNGKILRTMTSEILKQHKAVEEYKIHPFNPGCTLVKLKFDK